MIRMRVMDKLLNIIGSVELEYQGGTAHHFKVVEDGYEVNVIFPFAFGFLDQNWDLLRETTPYSSSVQETFLDIGDYAKPELLPGWQKIPSKPMFFLNHELR